MEGRRDNGKLLEFIELENGFVADFMR
ncbi:hypothetical protein A2U01_0118612, partial [Trifolium medium]|nr:hypothetical protein [Trifolium medium]